MSTVHLQLGTRSLLCQHLCIVFTEEKKKNILYYLEDTFINILGITCTLYTCEVEQQGNTGFAYKHHVGQRAPGSNLEGEAVLQPSVNATGQVGWWHEKTEKAGKWKKAPVRALQQVPA